MEPRFTLNNGNLLVEVTTAEWERWQRVEAKLDKILALLEAAPDEEEPPAEEEPEEEPPSDSLPQPGAVLWDAGDDPAKPFLDKPESSSGHTASQFFPSEGAKLASVTRDGQQWAAIKLGKQGGGGRLTVRAFVHNAQWVNVLPEEVFMECDLLVDALPEGEGFWNLVQEKQKTGGSGSDSVPVLSVNVHPTRNVLTLNRKIVNNREDKDDVAWGEDPLKVGEPNQIRVYIKRHASQGRVIAWLNGKLQFDVSGIQTRYVETPSHANPFEAAWNFYCNPELDKEATAYFRGLKLRAVA